ncbi:MAG: hypothetical protein F2667_03715 [Actinobacteria bacterium]|uniref:Unannotated protein n=1 Tax=freshwater metagenome TaxID=449393 RepID=A0A6J6PCP9_9ZZZZ|nr:hypothetical protein [Actinomycetota bacterium]
MTVPTGARALAPLLRLGLLLSLLAPVTLTAWSEPAVAGVPSTPVAARAGAPLVQRVNVSWEGTRKKRVVEKSAVIPGIGNVTLVCKPSSTMVRLYANDRSAETQMWLAKYETKNDHAVVAVKNARIYRYANADDSGLGGTGSFAHEGLNQQTPIEDYSSGHLQGVISQRPGRHQAAGGVTPPPATSFTLNWWWTGFRHDLDWRSCSMSAVFTTQLDERIGVSWHGDADAAGHLTQQIPVEGIGDILVRCDNDPDANGSAGQGGEQTIAIQPVADVASVYVEYVTGEGLVEDHVEELSLARDPVTGLLGPLPLPRNGMMRLFVTVGGVERDYVLSSYYVTNNAKQPQLNVCEVAAALTS